MGTAWIVAGCVVVGALMLRWLLDRLAARRRRALAFQRLLVVMAAEQRMRQISRAAVAEMLRVTLDRSERRP